MWGKSRTNRYLSNYVGEHFCQILSWNSNYSWTLVNWSLILTTTPLQFTGLWTREHFILILFRTSDLKGAAFVKMLISGQRLLLIVTISLIIHQLRAEEGSENGQEETIKENLNSSEESQEDPVVKSIIVTIPSLVYQLSFSTCVGQSVSSPERSTSTAKKQVCLTNTTVQSCFS